MLVKITAKKSIVTKYIKDSLISLQDKMTTNTIFHENFFKEVLDLYLFVESKSISLKKEDRPVVFFCVDTYFLQPTAFKKELYFFTA